MKRGTACIAHKHWSDVPENDHHIWPLEYGGPTKPWNLARVCMNAHGDIHYFIDLLLKYKGSVPWATAKTFGKKTRDIALRGYNEIVAHKTLVEVAAIRETAVRRLEQERTVA